MTKSYQYSRQVQGIDAGGPSSQDPGHCVWQAGQDKYLLNKGELCTLFLVSSHDVSPFWVQNVVAKIH